MSVLKPAMSSRVWNRSVWQSSTWTIESVVQIHRFSWEELGGDSSQSVRARYARLWYCCLSAGRNNCWADIHINTVFRFRFLEFRSRISRGLVFNTLSGTIFFIRARYYNVWSTQSFRRRSACATRNEILKSSDYYYIRDDSVRVVFIFFIFISHDVPTISAR